MIRRWQGFAHGYSNTVFESKMSDETGGNLCMTMEMYNLAEPR